MCERKLTRRLVFLDFQYQKNKDQNLIEQEVMNKNINSAAECQQETKLSPFDFLTLAPMVVK